MKEPALRPGEFWAVDNLSLSLHKKDILGIIGRNGSGKTTALRLFSGNLLPDGGMVSVRGTTKALLMSAMHLCYTAPVIRKMKLLSTLYGLSPTTFKQRFDSMLQLSGLSNMLEKPCTSLSLGMHLRLIFSVFLSLNASLYIIDEVLSSADEEFQDRSFETLKEKAHGSAVVVVSHNLELIRKLCTRICIIDNGSISYCSHSVSDGIDTYKAMISNKPGSEQR
ncbi:MAG: ATP-binding cassette domain-containing protein [Chitinivibrionales bacterium]|nr:ATP-binding cassette domain-containing protein [Chitinivibrionales bacterium]